MRSANRRASRHPATTRPLLTAALFAALASPAFASYEIDLIPGWNLISLPEQQEVVDIDEVTVSIEGKFRSIWAWEDGEWQVYDPSFPELSTLRTMDAGRAYWISMEQEGTLVGHGLRPASTIELAHGWNMIGFNDDEPADIGDLLGDTGPCISSIWAYESGSWTYYQRNSPQFSNLQYLRPGHGYWVKSNGACQLSVNLSIPSTTKTVRNNELALLSEVTADQLLFSSTTPNLDTVRIGDVLACPPTNLAPTGFLRKIANITQIGGGLRFTTQLAEIEDALEDAAVGTTISFDPSQAKTVETPEFKLVNSTELSKGTSPGDPRNPLKGVINITKNLGDGTLITFTGSIEIENSFLFNAEVENWSLEGFTCLFTGEVDANISVSASQTAEIPLVEFKVGEPIRWPTITLWAGWFPITITPEVQIYVGAKGSVGATATAKVGVVADATAGLTYNRLNRWEPVREFNWDFYHSPISAGFSAAIKGYVGPELRLIVYELAGPYIRVQGFGEFVVSTLPPPLQLWVGAEFKTGVTTGGFLEMFGISARAEYPLSAQIQYRIYPAENAIIVGKVVDEWGDALSGVRVHINTAGQKEVVYTDHNGDYRLEVIGGFYSEVVFSKDGYQTSTVENHTFASGQVTSLPVVRMFRQGIGSFAGAVFNALTGQAVPGLGIHVRPGMNNRTGGTIAETTTDLNGEYQVSYVPAGMYTIEVGGTGYQTGYFSAICLENTSTGNQNGTVTPLLDSNEIRIVLSWGSSPSDLDSHLTGPIGGSSSRFHVYYPSSNRGSLTTAPYAYLDRDDRDRYGPETITITEVFEGVYRYSVHNYSDRNSSSSDSLAYSSAHVDVYFGSDLWRSFDVPSQPGTLWTVFEYSDGEMTDINTMSYESNPASVQKSLSTDAQLLRELPPKEAK